MDDVIHTPVAGERLADIRLLKMQVTCVRLDFLVKKRTSTRNVSAGGNDAHVKTALGVSMQKATNDKTPDQAA